MTRLGVAAALVDGQIQAGDVQLGDDGRVCEVGLPPGRRGLAAPGLVDLQVNGYAGVDLLSSDSEQWVTAAQALARDGVTAFVANLVTAPPDATTRGLRAAKAAVSWPTTGAARCLGAHLEGPYLAPSRRGTHSPEHLRAPDTGLTEAWLEEGPVVGVTLAPELPGALHVIQALARRGVLVALGHSAATAAEAHAGFDAGARTVTHVFNGMGGVGAREPGLAGVALARSDVAVQLICDGVHLAAETAALVMAAARSRFVLVTDATAGARAEDGAYRLGELQIDVREGRARNQDGGLAGSVLTLIEAVRCAVAAGATVEDALAAASLRPAGLLGDPSLGRLRPGDPADVVVLDDALQILQAYVAGQPVE